MSWKLSEDPLGQLETAIAEDDMNGANNVVFELTRARRRDLATAYAATERCLYSGNRVLRSIGLGALGHIARVWDALDEKFKELLEQALVDPDREIRRQAEHTAMVIYSFLHWHFRNWTPKEEPISQEERFEDVPADRSGPVTTASDLVMHHYGNQLRKEKGFPPRPPLPY